MELSAADQKKLETAGILAVILFGSQSQGTANDASDYDVFVIGSGEKTVYDLVYDVMSSAINKLVDIDIVFDADAPLELKNHVASYGKVLYQKTPIIFADFREKTMREYADFAPLRAIFQKATLGRIAV